ncbi:SDR family oxidoreductase [bacterium]|nr:SDR family oxidoreductase [bacterium]
MDRKVILVTGASSGIGRATALHFQQAGWNVVATMRSPEKEAELNKLENVLVTRLDVLDSQSISEAVNAAVERFGGIEVLVNNAGYGAYGPLEAFPLEGIRRQFDTNVLGLLEVTRAVLPHMRRAGSGHIVNISSIGGRVTFPLGTLYHGTKWAVEGISEALSYELRHIGIRVKVVEPGAIATDFAGRSFDFTNDEGMAEYQPVVQNLWSGFGAALEQTSPPSVVAEVIMSAVTDGSDRLRYQAGDDAVAIVAQREMHGDEAWMAGIRQRFGIRG